MIEKTVQRMHRGDIMSPETRSRVMSRIRGRDTGPERLVEVMLNDLGVDYCAHVRSLPGRPDFVLVKYSLCIFVDGDFWHGYRFQDWRLKLSEAWDTKIAKNIRRDAQNRRLLRSAGWQVLRMWEHQVKKSPSSCKARIKKRIAQGLPYGQKPGNIDAIENPAGSIKVIFE
ncbi:very short patch repair endonuclease [Rhizobium rhizogenes]|uniref:very short patch repair endonuclease n=1 Tax=Rhizobium rhizogenes TaxID=359 RepID=UPI0015740670|nr:very short patch repair endonuclease [Rhizobium rhizogenes]NTG08841.1 very short patch repair endonuclease [Rhizobium rhizogenes]